MDLQDFNSEALYFDEPMAEEVSKLIAAAAEAYSSGGAEVPLLEAYRLAPDSLSVLVGLYRFYFYQHRFSAALVVAHQVMAVIAPRITFPKLWSEINERTLVRGVLHSISLVRFYLLALKAAGYINLRLARFAEGKGMLEKVVALDTADRLGARVLLDILAGHTAEVVAFPAARNMGVRS